jgi:hypothetical protein
MNGFIKAAAAGLCLATGFTTVTGCNCYRQILDPCWPERYSAEARLSVRDTFGAQAYNGHILDQTVWNYHFEVDPKTGAPTDKLNPGGMEHLKYLARRRPVADPHLFLQTAQDVLGAANLSPERFAHAREELDNRRVAAVQRYLAIVTSGRDHVVAFQVAVLDPAEVGIPATPIGGSGMLKNPVVKGSVNEWFLNSKGKIEEKAGTLTTGGTGGG